MKKVSVGLFLSAVLFMLLVQSCGVNSNLMFKQAKNDINFDSIPMQPTQEYKISADDKISFTLSTNNGSQIIEAMSGVSDEGAQANSGVEYLVRTNGEVRLPVIGKIKVEGLTVEECEDTLAHFYSEQYREPFVQVKVTNQRVIVFTGNGSDANVIPLTHTNTTLMEALALAGGITDRGKANTIKLMRKVNGVREVYGIDLSKIEGLKYVDMIVQANDYIYVEPTPELTKEILKDVVPVISLISSALFIYSAINVLK
ncbi:MAG: polysaccharide biosynthesis/export family protein [Crocinitomicaceae bacterium]|nr:polysaccharide biosynthesis/export family protein [Crocinitomicaceae bacterium]